VDSVDSLRLAERLNDAARRATHSAGRLEVLIEINIGGEAAKAGLAPESDELRALLAAQPRLPHLAIRGLMCVPPATAEAEGARGFFRELRRLRDRLRDKSGLELPELSMGMSHDFEVAIEEGSTCVRVGTAIFGARNFAAIHGETGTPGAGKESGR
jgi:pyridoxal phosphate enzyme (YggS family)